MNLIIDGIIYSLQNNGGISRVFNEILDEITELDEFDLSVLIYKKSGVVFDKNSTQWSDKVIQRAYRPLERIRSVDTNMFEGGVFHSSYYRLPTNRSLSVITTVHDFTHEILNKGIKSSLFKYQKYNALKKSEKIVCISKSTRNDLLRMYPDINEKKIDIIYNGVSSEFYIENTNLLSYRKKNYVLFVGSRAPYKGFDRAVRAVSKITDISLVIVGGGALSKSESNMLDELVPSRFELVGNISDDLLRSYYNGALCLIYPSLYEGFGLPVVEAQACGCPVLAVNSSSIPEVHCGIVPLMSSGSAKEIESLIRYLLVRPLGDADRLEMQTWTKRFSWHKTAMAYASLYNSFSKI